MIDKALVDILLCPENRARLRLVEGPALEKLNAAIAAGQIRTRRGPVVCNPLEMGLLRDDNAVLYPIVDGIPMLLVDEGIVVPAGVF